ncbi:MAG: glutathione S-transferase family protein [Solirubrobacteraceae bacterium]
MPVTLYWMTISHPSQAARRMVELKGIDHKLVTIAPMAQKLHLRAVGFRRGTVPAMKVDGKRVHGSRQIARALDQRWPEPGLFPRDPELRARVEEAERWGEHELQPIPRRIFRWAIANDAEFRRGVLEMQSMPAVGLLTRVTPPIVRYYSKAPELDGRSGGADGVRDSLAALPALLDDADALIADGTLTTDPPNAASLQILATIRTLGVFSDLHELLEGRPSLSASRSIGLSPAKLPTVPSFLPAQWLPARDRAA